MELKNLKPCPYCFAGTKELRWFKDGEKFLPRIVCENCYAFGPWGEDFSDATNKWNHRAEYNYKEDPMPCPFCGETKYINTEGDYICCEEVSHQFLEPPSEAKDLFNGAEGPTGGRWNSRT